MLKKRAAIYPQNVLLKNVFPKGAPLSFPRIHYYPLLHALPTTFTAITASPTACLHLVRLALLLWWEKSLLINLEETPSEFKERFNVQHARKVLKTSWLNVKDFPASKGVSTLRSVTVIHCSGVFRCYISFLGPEVVVWKNALLQDMVCLQQVSLERMTYWDRTP